MADYIDKQATIGAIHSAIYSYFCGAEDGDALSDDEKLVLSVNKAICTAIKAFPSADVQPVVRCKECRWYKTNYMWNGTEVKICAKEAYEPRRNADDFCSNGERK